MNSIRPPLLGSHQEQWPQWYSETPTGATGPSLYFIPEDREVLPPMPENNAIELQEIQPENLPGTQQSNDGLTGG